MSVPESVIHFALRWNNGRYLLVHRFQRALFNCSLRCRNIFRFEAVLSLDREMGHDTFAPSTRKLFGVIVCKSSTSLITAVRGRLLGNCSAMQNIVERFSSFNDSLPKILKIALLLDFTNDFHASPKCGAAGGMEFRSISFCAKLRCISDWFKSLKTAFNSLAAPTKLLPLSEIFVFGFPFLAMNQWTASKQDCKTSIDWTISTCTALTLRHVRRQFHPFTVLRKSLIENGPNESTPVFVNGVTLSSILTTEKFDIIGIDVSLLVNLQWTHWCFTDLSRFLRPVTQSSLWISALICSTYWWCLFLCWNSRYNLTPGRECGKITGFFSPKLRFACLSRPLALIWFLLGNEFRDISQSSDVLEAFPVNLRWFFVRITGKNFSIKNYFNLVQIFYFVKFALQPIRSVYPATLHQFINGETSRSQISCVVSSSYMSPLINCWTV